jgi:hypothetical protein
MDLLLKSSDLEDHLESVLINWMRYADDLRTVLVLYLSALYGEHLYVENKFLSMCQAAEVFHRRFHEGEYMDAEQYKTNVLPLLRSRIPSDLNSELISAMQQRLEFMNEFSLGKRLKDLVNENRGIVSQLVPDIKNVLRSIVETRNRYTHFSGKGPTDAFRGETILYYLNVLRIILESAILKKIGVRDEVLRPAAINSEQYRRMLKLGH